MLYFLILGYLEICVHVHVIEKVTNEFEKWHAIRASVGGALAWVMWVVCQRE